MLPRASQIFHIVDFRRVWINYRRWIRRNRHGPLLTKICWQRPSALEVQVTTSAQHNTSTLTTLASSKMLSLTANKIRIIILTFHQRLQEVYPSRTMMALATCICTWASIWTSKHSIWQTRRECSTVERLWLSMVRHSIVASWMIRVPLASRLPQIWEQQL